jgi:hypothetical protein
MESSQALLKYKAKLQTKNTQNKISKPQSIMPITYLTQREIEWCKRLCPTFDRNINNIIYLKKR